MNYTEEFDKARKLYPGVKLGLEPEFNNFRKKYKKTWKQIIPLLFPAIQEQIEWRKYLRRKNKFVPEWKHFKTWINNFGWTQECKMETKKREIDHAAKFRAREREEQEGWLISKSTEALLDLKKDKKALVAHWLIDEILEKRK